VVVADRAQQAAGERQQGDDEGGAREALGHAGRMGCDARSGKCATRAADATPPLRRRAAVVARGGRLARAKQGRPRRAGYTSRADCACQFQSAAADALRPPARP
jgi:hypothetical protein